MASITSTLYNQARQFAQACEVPSFTTREKAYTVRDAFTPFCSCTCEDWTYRRQRELGDQRTCKHIRWVRSVIERLVAFVIGLREELDSPFAPDLTPISSSGSVLEPT